MTRPDRDYDDILSRVLHSTLDPIEPMGDGLAKIQRRIAEPWLKRQVSLLRTETSTLGWLILVRCEPFFSWARSSLTAASEASGRWLRPGPARRGTAARAGRHGSRRGRSAEGLGWLGPTMAWLRPALAVAGAVVIVVAGVFTVTQIRLAISPTANSSTSGNHGHGGQPGSHHKGGPSLQTSGATGPGRHPAPGHSTKPAAKAKQAAPSASCSSAPTSTTSPSPSPTITSPTPTPTTPTSTPTPTGSPSPTAPSGGPVGSGNGGETNDVAAVSFRAAKSLRGYVVRGSCVSPSSSSSGPTGSSSGFGSS